MESPAGEKGYRIKAQQRGCDLTQVQSYPRQGPRCHCRNQYGYITQGFPTYHILLG